MQSLPLEQSTNKLPSVKQTKYCTAIRSAKVIIFNSETFKGVAIYPY
jgi:hypothetical protein